MFAILLARKFVSPPSILRRMEQTTWLQRCGILMVKRVLQGTSPLLLGISIYWAALLLLFSTILTLRCHVSLIAGLLISHFGLTCCNGGLLSWVGLLIVLRSQLIGNELLSLWLIVCLLFAQHHCHFLSFLLSFLCQSILNNLSNFKSNFEYEK